jgi:hypothetical protein
MDRSSVAWSLSLQSTVLITSTINSDRFILDSSLGKHSSGSPLERNGNRSALWDANNPDPWKQSVRTAAYYSHDRAHIILDALHSFL